MLCLSIHVPATSTAAAAVGQVATVVGGAAAGATAVVKGVEAVQNIQKGDITNGIAAAGDVALVGVLAVGAACRLSAAGAKATAAAESELAAGESGATGAFNPAAANVGGDGLGVLAGGEIAVTQKGLDLVSNHLSTFETVPGEFPQNTMMLQRLQGAIEAGQKVSGADAVFYTHEAAEATMMGRGMSYDAAHAAALAKYNVSPYSVYHPDVIRALPEQFNSNWSGFWGLSE